MRNILALFLLFGEFAWAQNPSTKAISFNIIGVGAGVRDTLNIAEHSSGLKYEDTKFKGFFVKDVLDNTVETKINPKLYGKFYYAFTDVEGYIVVHPRNELLNKMSDKLYIIVEKKLIIHGEIPQSIQMVSTVDFITGQLYFRSLLKAYTVFDNFTY